MVYSVRTKAYQIVALNTDAVTAAGRLVEHMKANGLQLGDYVVIVRVDILPRHKCRGF